MGWIITIAIGVLRGSGYPELAEWLEDAPKKLGEEIGRILIADGLRSQGRISRDAIGELEKLKQANPLPLPPSPKNLLGEYTHVLNALLELARPLNVFAVKGFLHCSECLVVICVDWEKLAKTPLRPTKGFSDEETLLFYGPGVKVFVNESVSISDERLVELNRNIERERKNYLPKAQAEFPFQVRSVSENEVFLEATTVLSILNSEESRPITSAFHIVEAFRTLPLAKEAQQARLREWQQAREARGS